MPTLTEMTQQLAERLQGSANVKSVYGEPIREFDRTIVPVAKIGYGLGAGIGTGKTEQSTEAPGGSGIGAGMGASPAGVLEIDANGTRFIPYDNNQKLAAAVGIGVILGLLLAGLFAKR